MQSTSEGELVSEHMGRCVVVIIVVGREGGLRRLCALVSHRLAV